MLTSIISNFSLSQSSLKQILNIVLVFFTQDLITKSITKFQICDLDFAWAPGFQSLLHIGT